MFKGESPENYEQKCLCVLVLDTSGSMDGEPILELNKGLQDFHHEVAMDFVASQRLEVSIVSFNSTTQVLREPALLQNLEMPRLSASGTTKLVDAVRTAMFKVEERKQWYRETGQNYYRPMIVLITDGEPDSDQDLSGLSDELQRSVAAKKFSFYALGVRGYNHAKLAQVCPPSTPPLPLDGYKFSEFFKWLSNSIGIITKSKEGDTLSLPPVSGWTQIQV